MRINPYKPSVLFMEHRRTEQIVASGQVLHVRLSLLYVHSSIAIILMGKRELIALLNLSSWCLVMVERLFLAVPRGCLQFVIVVFPDHTHLLIFRMFYYM